MAGDSAGGNLAAVMTQMARDAGGPRLKFQLLWYPATLLDPNLPSMIANADAPVLDATDMRLYEHCYLGDRPPVEPSVAPGRAADLSGLPAAYVAVAEFDPLHDDGVRYAELLQTNGNAVELADHTGLTHGFVGYVQWVPVAAEALARSLAALTAAL